jgi:hypothetical protein
VKASINGIGIYSLAVLWAGGRAAPSGSDGSPCSAAGEMQVSGIVVLAPRSQANCALPGSPFPFKSCCGRGDGHAGRGGLPHQFNLRLAQAVGLVDEVAERALQGQGFGGEGAGGGNGAGVFVAQGVRCWRRTEGAGPGQNNSFGLLPLLPSPSALQVLHSHTWNKRF